MRQYLIWKNRYIITKSFLYVVDWIYWFFNKLSDECRLEIWQFTLKPRKHLLTWQIPMASKEELSCQYPISNRLQPTPEGTRNQVEERTSWIVSPMITETSTMGGIVLIISIVQACKPEIYMFCSDIQRFIFFPVNADS